MYTIVNRVLVTGGAGFIGSAVIRYLMGSTSAAVLNIDKLTYAGNLSSLQVPIDDSHASDANIVESHRYQFLQADIADQAAMAKAVNDFKPDAIMNLAAESHVDRSIDSPNDFIDTNIKGTFILLQVALKYWQSLPEPEKSVFRFHHISTDEVYGSLGDTGLFTEQSSYDPRSPYSASKAASDHLAKAWFHTYGLPVIVTNCSNNYGPYHFPEKLVPHVILSALEGKPLPIYGNGLQVRDWLYVEDHAKALLKVVNDGVVGETYNIGGSNEKTNIEVVQTICSLLEELAPNKPLGVNQYCDLITFVKDRAGHDIRYAVDASKIKLDLGWLPDENFESGLRKTVEWYLNNRHWWERVLSGAYRLERLGDKL